MTWQSIIRDAAYTRFCKTGDMGPFRLARRDLFALCREISGMDPGEYEGRGFHRVQARVFVPALSMIVLVDEWAKLETP